MSKYLYWTTLTGLSGSLLYHCYYDFNKIEATKKQDTTTTIKGIKTVLNPGLIVGILIGATYAYTGKPVINLII